MSKRTIAMVVASMLAVSMPANAQNTGNGGVSLAVGAGAGWARVSCDICQTSRDLGPSAFVRVATAVRPGLRVAAEATAWTHEVEDERENLGSLMALLYLHPKASALYVKGGLGYVGYRAGEDIGMNALGMQFGAGYELRLGGLGLNNYVNLIGSSFGSLKNDDTVIAEDVSTTMLQLGVGITLR
ncbi:MAG TPA: outer membrane beta-barrel protein [Longimicrobiales bacterium]